MSELAATIREALAALAAGDPARTRFGAKHHRYELVPPLAASELAVVEARTGPLPDDLRELSTTLGAGGAGPYLGWLGLADAASLVYAAPRDVTAWHRALPVGHLGCGYAAVLALDGEARGTIWIDARTLGIVAPIHPSFTAYYLDWIDRLAHNRLVDTFVPPGACALANALGGYLGIVEQQRGLAAGSIAGDELRDALAQLGPGAIAIAADRSPLIPDGAHVAPCLACATTLANLGLTDEVVAS